LWSAAEGSSERFFANDFSETKVCESDVQVFVVKKNVFKFDIAMDNVAVMLKKS